MTRVPANRLMPIVVQNYVRTETDDRHSIPAAIFSFRWALTFGAYVRAFVIWSGRNWPSTLGNNSHYGFCVGPYYLKNMIKYVRCGVTIESLELCLGPLSSQQAKNASNTTFSAHLSTFGVV
jgi:hypothetical protein